MKLSDLLEESREPRPFKELKELVESFSFEKNQKEVINTLLHGKTTISQKCVLIDGLSGTDLDDLNVEVKIALMLVMKSALDEVDSLIQSPIQTAPTPKPPRKLRLVKNEEV